MGYRNTMIAALALDAGLGSGMKDSLVAALDAGDKTLEEHDKQYHPEGYKEGDECKFREKEKAKDDADVAEGDNGGKKVSPYVKSKGAQSLFRVGDSDRLGWTRGWMAEEGEAERNPSHSGSKLAYLMLENPLSLMDGYDDNGEEDEEREKDFKVKAFCDVMEKAGVKIDRELIKANFNASENPTIDNLIEEVGKKEFEEALKKLGYDGYVWDYDDRRVTAFDKDKVVHKDGEKKKRDDKGEKPLVTPEEDAAYMEAVEKGDMETAARMVREVAGRAFPNTKIVDEDGLPKVVWHATEWNPYKESNGSAIFDMDKIGTAHDKGYYGKGFYFGRSKEGVRQYLPYKDGKTSGNIMPFFLNVKNPIIKPAGGYDSDTPIDSDGIIVGGDRYYEKPYYDPINFGEFIAFAPSQIKSADSVTYDAQGNVIPLSRRFDKGDDIRGDVTSSHKKGTDMEQSEEKKEEPKSSENGLERTLSDIGLNIYRPAIAETMREVSGEIPESLISASEQFDREVEGMKNGEKSYADVRDAYSRLKSACNGVSWAKDILKLASKVTKACAKEDIDAE